MPVLLLLALMCPSDKILAHGHCCALCMLGKSGIEGVKMCIALFI